MARPAFIELESRGSPLRIPILHEDRAALAIDKPAGWLLAPTRWQRTGRNLQAALESSIAAGDFWARSRHLRYLRFVHRLDAETGGVLLLAKSPGALRALSELFESRQVVKVYLAVVHGIPRQREWLCQLHLMPDPGQPGRVKVDARHGKDAATRFRVLQIGSRPGREDCALVEARPLTGRTHQIRVHLAATGHPVVGDPLYGTGTKARPSAESAEFALALRAVELAYPDPFTRKAIHIRAPEAEFLRCFGFGPVARSPARA
jgi:RluA family pseudouridine synthase